MKKILSVVLSFGLGVSALAQTLDRDRGSIIM